MIDNIIAHAFSNVAVSELLMKSSLPSYKLFSVSYFSISEQMGLASIQSMLVACINNGVWRFKWLLRQQRARAPGWVSGPVRWSVMKFNLHPWPALFPVRCKCSIPLLLSYSFVTFLDTHIACSSWQPTWHTSQVDTRCKHWNHCVCFKIWMSHFSDQNIVVIIYHAQQVRNVPMLLISPHVMVHHSHWLGGHCVWKRVAGVFAPHEEYWLCPLGALRAAPSSRCAVFLSSQSQSQTFNQWHKFPNKEYKNEHNKKGKMSCVLFLAKKVCFSQPKPEFNFFG